MHWKLWRPAWPAIGSFHLEMRGYSSFFLVHTKDVHLGFETPNAYDQDSKSVCLRRLVLGRAYTTTVIDDGCLETALLKPAMDLSGPSDPCASDADIPMPLSRLRSFDVNGNLTGKRRRKRQKGNAVLIHPVFSYDPVRSSICYIQRSHITSILTSMYVLLAHIVRWEMLSNWYSQAAVTLCPGPSIQSCHGALNGPVPRSSICSRASTKPRL